MPDHAIVDRLVQLVREYADGRASDVARGAETPRLAALLVQKYGRGVVDAAALFFDSAQTASPISKAVDEATTEIDPLWREHDRERWTARPADISIGP